jgi:hypothetical protein
MTAEEALRRYARTWDRVKQFNDIKYMKNPKRRKLWQRAHDAWLKYLEAVK